MSSTSSIYSGIATGEGLAVPSPTYLRTRYKNLQSRKVSGNPIPSNDSNPSLQATEHSDSPEMVIADAVIGDHETDNNGPSDRPTTSRPKCQGQPPATTEHDLLSFRSRVDEVIQAVDRGRHATPDQDRNLSVFASDAGSLSESSSESSSEESVATQIAARPENFRRILGPDHRDAQRSPSSRRRSPTSRPENVMPLGYILSDQHQSPSSKAASSGDQSSYHDATIPVRRRSVSPIISPEDQKALAQHIQDKIVEHEKGERKAVPTTVIHQGLRKGVNPRNLYTIGKNGIKCLKISPIPLNSEKVRRLGTPEVSTSDSSSAESSVLNYVATRRRKTAIHANTGEDPGPARGKALGQKSCGILSDKASPGKTSSFYYDESDEDPVERQAKNRNVASWLRCVGSALKPSESSPAKKLGKAFGGLKVNSSPSKKTERALQDITNIRKPGYLKWNSFAQDKLAKQKVKRESSNRDQENFATHVTLEDVTAESPSRVSIVSSAGASIGSSRSSGKASTIKLADAEHELHPETLFALARLEGCASPCPSPPYQILRCVEMDYDSDVEIEQECEGPHYPRPCRAIRIGELAESFQSLVDAGFDCGLGPAEES